jgi:hypothetical protein
MSSPYCAICGNHVPRDRDYVSVLGTHKLINDRNEQDDYILHRECWNNLTEGWELPA